MRKPNGNSQFESYVHVFLFLFKSIFIDICLNLMEMEKLFGVVRISLIFNFFLILYTHDVADPQLTPLGIEQAYIIHDMWKTESSHGLAPPHRIYCSPLSRALRTCDIMLDGVFRHNHGPVTVVEVSNSLLNL